MILPYPLDLLPEFLGRAKVRLTNWSVQGQRVRIYFDPPDDSLISGDYVGFIDHLVDRIATVGPHGKSDSDGPFAILRLEQPILVGQRNVHFLIAMSKYAGHKPWRLAVAACVVNFYEMDNGSPPRELNREAFIGSGLMTIE